MKAGEAKRLTKLVLEQENTRLKKLLAEVDKAMLKDLAGEISKTGAQSAAGPSFAGDAFDIRTLGFIQRGTQHSFAPAAATGEAPYPQIPSHICRAHRPSEPSANLLYQVSLPAQDH